MSFNSDCDVFHSSECDGFHSSGCRVFHSWCMCVRVLWRCVCVMIGVDGLMGESVGRNVVGVDEVIGDSDRSGMCVVGRNVVGVDGVIGDSDRSGVHVGCLCGWVVSR